MSGWRKGIASARRQLIVRPWLLTILLLFGGAMMVADFWAYRGHRPFPAATPSGMERR